MSKIDSELSRHWELSQTEYQEWIARHDTPTGQDLDAINEHIKNLNGRVSFSVLTIAEECGHRDFSEMLQSMQCQLFRNWELLVFAGPNQRLMDVAAEAAVREPRIRLLTEPMSGGRAAIANALLDRSTGDFVAWLPAAGNLSDRALYRFAAEILEGESSAEILYCDTDRLVNGGRRSRPHFKSAWDPEHILGTDYCGSCVFFHRGAAVKTGGFREACERAEVYDLLLRMTDTGPARKVRHVPAILYHEVVAHFGHRAKMKENSELKAVTEALARRGGEIVQVESVPSIECGRRIVWPVPEVAPLVSIIIPTRDRANLVQNVVKTIVENTTYQHFEIIIADNDSALPETFELFSKIKHDSRVKIIETPGPFNYSAINNSAISRSNGQILVLMNNDVEVIDGGWLTEMVSQACRPDVGAVGAKLLYEDGRIQHAGVACGPNVETFHPWRLSDRADPGYFGALSIARSCIAVTGACLALRRDVFDRVNGLNETHLRVAFNDVDLCLKIRKLGYKILWTPFATLYHLESVSRGQEDTPEKQQRARLEMEYMLATWHKTMHTDPYHNPNTQFTWDHMMRLSGPKHGVPWGRYLPMS